MSTTAGDLRTTSVRVSWRTPLIVIACGCAIGMLSFGPRSALGFFIQPMSRDLAWGRDVFGLALAVQNLLWGLGQPLAKFAQLRAVLDLDKDGAKRRDDRARDRGFCYFQGEQAASPDVSRRRVERSIGDTIEHFFELFV